MIELAFDAVSTRRKFTLAHEVGHFAYRSLGLRTPEPEEVWCNRFAADLLMPHSVVRQEFGSMRPSLWGISLLHRRAKVSVAAAAIQLRTTCRWQLGLLRFTRDRGTWRLEAAHAPDARLNLHTLRAVADTVGALECASGERPRVLPLGYRDRVVTLHAEYSGTADACWVAFPVSGLRQQLEAQPVRGASGQTAGTEGS